MRRLRVFLDSNVLVDAQIRDLILRLAEAELIDLAWSLGVLDEVERVLRDRLGVPAAKAQRVIQELTRTFPHAAVTDYEHLIDTLVLPDPDDRHVLAAAAKAQCDFLITSNLGDFPDSVSEPLDLLVVEPDEALMLLCSEFKDELAAVVNAQIAALQHPRMSMDEFLSRLSQRAPQATMVIGATLDVEPYKRMFHEAHDAQRDDSPQGVVRSLLDAVARADRPAVLACLTPELRGRIVASAEYSGDPAGFVADQLADVVNSRGWGFATARRIAGPNAEYVKLVRAGSEPVIARSPQIHQGHLFGLIYGAGGWLVHEIDGPDPAFDEETE